MDPPTVRMIFGMNWVNSELCNEPDTKLFEGSKLDPSDEESEESRDDGEREVVMYPKSCNRRGRNSLAPVVPVHGK